MGSSTPTYLGETIIAEYDRPKFETDLSNHQLLEREATNHSLSLRGIEATANEDGTETVRIGIENVRDNLHAVAAFQRALSLFFRFNTFQQLAVEQPSLSPATDDGVAVDPDTA